MRHSRWLFLLIALAWATPTRAAPAPSPDDRAAPSRRVAEPPPASPDGAPPPDRAADPGDPDKPQDKPPPEGTTPPGKATPKEMTPPIKKKNLSHRLQVSVDVSVGVGASFIVTYKDTTWCGRGDPQPENDSFCTGLDPVHMDFGLGFTVIDALEILVEFRLGLMEDMVGNRPLMLMPGLRVWLDPKQAFKIGLALQMVVDFTKQDSPEQLNNLPENGQKLDLGARFYAQIQYDFLRYVGLFGRVGLVGTFQKWIGMNLEAQLGVQARFP